MMTTYPHQSKPDFVLVNNVKFQDSRFDKNHSGSAFLLQYQSKVYGVTAKHILQFTKTDSMNAVYFGNDLKSWEFVSPLNPGINIKAGRLLNENQEELLTAPLNGDWLLFEIQELIPPEVFIFEPSLTPLVSGEVLTARGYLLHSNQLIEICGEFIAHDYSTKSFLMEAPQGNYLGCSGGPVTNEEGKIVGLISKGYFDSEKQKMIFQPASISYFFDVING